MAESNLMAVSPLDGRYADRVEVLSPIVSEYGLMKYRVAVEVEWLRTLRSGVLPDIDPLSKQADEELARISLDFSEEDAGRIKEIESVTKHDVKAVEMWLREKLEDRPELQDQLELIHFGCTSEDINNLAYAMMFRDVRDDVLLPAFDDLGRDLETKAHDYADIALLARTHGQPATPTTVGKELAVFVKRLNGVVKNLGQSAINGKFNGATGNYSAVSFAYPDIDWETVSRAFVENLGFTFNDVTTQIESHDGIAEFSNELALANTILTDLARDMWLYISNGVFKQITVEGEVGSSTMPHKVNPIDHENAEANFGIANALLTHLAGKLPISRLQRDLSDSSSFRAFGEAFGHTVVAISSLNRGLKKVEPDLVAIEAELKDEWAILAEPLQTVMRKHNVANAYDVIKRLSRGKPFSGVTYKEIVKGLDIPVSDKKRLLDLTPLTYVGLAPKIARSAKYSRV